MENNQVTIPSEDDGSLAFLRIPRDENSRCLPLSISSGFARGSGGRNTAIQNIY